MQLCLSCSTLFTPTLTLFPLSILSLFLIPTLILLLLSFSFYFFTFLLGEIIFTSYVWWWYVFISLLLCIIFLSSNEYLGSLFFFLFFYNHHFLLLHRNSLSDIKPTIFAFVYFFQLLGTFFRWAYYLRHWLPPLFTSKQGHQNCIPWSWWLVPDPCLGPGFASHILSVSLTYTVRCLVTVTSFLGFIFNSWTKKWHLILYIHQVFRAEMNLVSMVG